MAGKTKTVHSKLVAGQPTNKKICSKTLKSAMHQKGNLIAYQDTNSKAKRLFQVFIGMGTISAGDT